MEIQVNDSENSPTQNIKYAYLSTQAKRAHVRAYQSTGQTMIAYCEQTHLALSTFKAWVSKYGEKKSVTGFIPMIVDNKNQVTAEIKNETQRLEIQKGDFKIIFPGITNLEMTIHLIKGIIACN